ncbi:hypothetical protein ACFVSU_16665 [Microbacterium sp. NPDC058062]|uniref:hypothetical protein n=1 Tax=Microbacterium sp. NPDC058062 TaxID=3346320 RepID=UPI0036DB4CF4
MNRFAPLAAASIVLAFALTACSSTPPQDSGKTPDTAPVASAEPTPEPTEDAAESEFGESATSTRGNLVKQIGQLAGTSSLASEVVTSRFAVTDIVLDPECTSGFADTPTNGHYLGVHLNVETTPELAQEEFPWISFTQYDWQAYDADGKRLNDPVGNAWSCLDSGQQLPAQIGPGQSVSGWIVLDVAATNGFVVLAMSGAPTGWEWAY